MIRRVELCTLPGRLLKKQPNPGLLAQLWVTGCGGLPQALTLYRCGAKTWLLVRGATAVVLGKLRPAQAQELESFLNFCGIETLYLPADARGLQGRVQQLLCLCRPAGRLKPRVFRRGQAFDSHVRPEAASLFAPHLQTAYLPVARLLCAGQPPEVQNDFYADLCSRRNRGQVRVWTLGPQQAPEACLLCAGPVALPGGLTGKRLKKEVCYLSDLLVQPALRRTGRGQALMETALADVSQETWLYCRPQLASYYQKMGFKPKGSVQYLRRFAEKTVPADENSKGESEYHDL